MKASICTWANARIAFTWEKEEKKKEKGILMEQYTCIEFNCREDAPRLWNTHECTMRLQSAQTA